MSESSWNAQLGPVVLGVVAGLLGATVGPGGEAPPQALTVASTATIASTAGSRTDRAAVMQTISCVGGGPCG